MKRRQRTHVMLDGERTTICGRTRVDAVLAMNGEDVTCTVCVQGLSYERVKKERDEARAEVAALRETTEARAYLRLAELNDGLRRDLAEARALLAEWVTPYVGSNGPITDKTRAFLRGDEARRGLDEHRERMEDERKTPGQMRDEARRCTCGLAQYPGLVEHTPNCGSVCAHRWVKEHGVNVDWCQNCGAQRPHPRDEAPTQSSSTGESKPPRR